jgi:hypothetical protein
MGFTKLLDGVAPVADRYTLQGSDTPAASDTTRHHGQIAGVDATAGFR